MTGVLDIRGGRTDRDSYIQRKPEDRGQPRPRDRSLNDVYPIHRERAQHSCTEVGRHRQDRCP
jgi:hypothetical protein